MSRVYAPPAVLRRPLPQLPAGTEVDRWGRRLVVVAVAVWVAGAVVGLSLSVTILTAIGFAAALAGLWRPAVGMLGIALLCTLDPLMNEYVFTGGVLRWNTFNYWLLLTIALFPTLLLRLQNGQVLLLECWVGLLALELLLSPDWWTGAQDVLGVVAALGLLLYFARGGGQAASWFWTAVLSGTVAVGGGLVYFLQPEALQVVNPNALVFLPITALVACCMGLPFATGRKRGQFVLALLSGLNFVLVFLTASRGGMLIGAACATFMVLGIRGLGRRTVLVSLMALTALAALSQFGHLQTYALARVHLLLDPNVTLTDRTSGRADLMLAGWYMFRDHPFGIGTGGFATAWSGLSVAERISGWGLESLKPAHAGWIKILVENGVPGILFFGAFLCSFAVAGWRSRVRGLLPLGLLVSLVLGLGFLTTEYQSKGLWFIAAGVMILLRRHPVAAHHGRTAGRP